MAACSRGRGGLLSAGAAKPGTAGSFARSGGTIESWFFSVTFHRRNAGRGRLAIQRGNHADNVLPPHPEK